MHLDDDAHDRRVRHERENEIRAVLGRDDLSEGRLLDTDVIVRGEHEAERVAKQGGDEVGALAEEEQGRFVRDRRHGSGRDS